jgi:DNA-binding transcriptional ArsR family regulator
MNRAAAIEVPEADIRVRAEKPLAQRLDRVIHDRTRLAILSALAASETLAFNELKAITGTTDGNLSVHARKLEDAGYVHCDKSFAGRVPRTEFRLTTAGRRALEKYLDHMESLIKATRDKKAGATGRVGKAGGAGGAGKAG